MDNGKLIYCISVNEEAKTIEICPMQGDSIILYGADWAEQFIQDILRHAHRLWQTEPSCSLAGESDACAEGTQNTFVLPLHELQCDRPVFPE